jgi:signal transduction histidine kinase
MKAKFLNQSKPLRRGVVRSFFLFALLGVSLPAFGKPLLLEHFDQDVEDESPVGNAPGWHALAMQNGVATDFTASIPNKDNYPSLAHTEGGARSGPWEWSIGYLTMPGYVASNVLVWVDSPTNFQGQKIGGFSFYSRNDSPDSSMRIAVRVGGHWYASTTRFQDVGKADWGLNTLWFKSSPNNWQILNTNMLALEHAPAKPLAAAEISAVGILGVVSGWGRIRIDEFQVVADSGFDRDNLVGSWIWDGHRVDRKLCRLWKAIEIPSGVSVKRARLRVTAHDTFRAFLDGNDFGLGSDWTHLAEYDLTKVFSPGQHVLAVEAFNEYEWAGLAAGLVVELADGRTLEIPTDETWRIVPEESKDWRTRKIADDNWPAATILFPFRDAPGLPLPVKVIPSSALQPIVLQFWQRGWFQLTLLSFCAVVAGICLRLLAKVTMQSKEKQVLQRERARIARDIHDDLGAVMTQLVLQGETAQNELAGETETRAKFKRISDTGRRLVQSINEVVWMVNSQRDSLRDFENYVCRYAETFLRASSIRCRLDVDGEIPEAAFGLAQRRSLFLAIKEVLNNVAKHSGATEVLLKILIENDEVKVTVEDNGKGFEFAARDRTRNGLSNMAQRMNEVGGQCKIVSRPGAGCIVELSAKVADLSDKHGPWWRWRMAHFSSAATKETKP